MCAYMAQFGLRVWTSLTYCYIGIDSSLSDNFGRSIIYGLSAITTIITISVVGGLPFILAAAVMGYLYWNGMLYRFTIYFWTSLITFLYPVAKVSVETL